MIDDPGQFQIAAERVRHSHLFGRPAFWLEQLGIAHQNADASRP
jgi:hypothetical protein